MKNILKLSGIYIGTIIGAGFASGQEIVSFFTSYGNKWIYGMIFSGFLFSLLGFIIIDTISNDKNITYKKFINNTLGRNLGSIMDIVSGLFLMILFFTMISAAGVTIHQSFKISTTVAKGLMILICFIIFLFDIEGISFINSILSPILILSGIIIGVSILFSYSTPTFSVYNNKKIIYIIFSSLLYVSYNMITAIPVLISAKEIAHSKNSKFAGLIGGFSMSLMGICIGMVLFINHSNIKNLEIPLMAIVSNINNLLYYLYIFMLLSAILTTALGNGFGAIKWLEEKINLKPIFIKLIVIFIALLMSFINFSYFVNIFYPIFGLIGIVEILIIIYKYFK